MTDHGIAGAYTESFGTRDEAIRAGKAACGDDDFFVTRTRPLSVPIIEEGSAVCAAADSWLDDTYEYDFGGVFEPTRREMNDLDARIQEVFALWCRAYGFLERRFAPGDEDELIGGAP